MAEKTPREQYIHDHRWRLRWVSARENVVMLVVILLVFGGLAPLLFHLIQGS